MKNEKQKREQKKPAKSLRQHLKSFFALLAITGGMAGCSMTHLPGDQNSASLKDDYQGAIVVSENDLKGDLVKLEQVYREDPENRQIALRFAERLRQSGKTAQAVAVLRRASTIHTDDLVIQAAYGKALAADGSFQNALNVIQTAQRPDLPDWRLISAEGAILDQLEQHQAARQRYTYALTLAPGEPAILSNLGMSHVLTGDLFEAEKYLRQAIAQENTDTKVRQNLALVLGLQGRMQEAEKVASFDLQPDETKANMAFIRNIIYDEEEEQALAFSADAVNDPFLNTQ